MVNKVTTCTILLLACVSGRIAAHDLPVSSMMMVADEDFLHVELTINSGELIFYRELDRDNNGRLELAEVREQADIISKRIVDCLSIEIDGKRLEADNCGIVPDMSTHHLTVRAHYAVDARDVPLSLESHLSNITNGAHTTQVTFRKPGSSESARLNARSPRVTFNLSPPATSKAVASRPKMPSPGAEHSKFLLVGVPIGLITLIVCLLCLRSRHLQAES
jgi:hypothetical protein